MMRRLHFLGHTEKLHGILKRISRYRLSHSAHALTESASIEKQTVKGSETFANKQIKLSQWELNRILDEFIEYNSVEEGKLLYNSMEQNKVFPNASLGNKFLRLFTNSGLLEEARDVFEKMPHRSLNAWVTLIAAYVRRGFEFKALKLLRRMQAEGMMPNRFVLPSTFRACANLRYLPEGTQLHACLMKLGFQNDLVVCNSVIDMYVKCKSLESAERFFSEMEKRNVVSWTALIDGYAKLGFLETARQLFVEMPEKNVVSWTSMILGYVKRGFTEEALEMFPEMLREGFEPDEVTVSSLVSGCGFIASVFHGVLIHGFGIKRGLDCNVAVQTALVDMYAKCGSLGDCRRAFELIPESDRDVAAWNAVIGGYAIQGYPNEVLNLLELMPDSSVKPLKDNAVYWTHLLIACVNGGMTDKGFDVFKHITEDQKTDVKEKHYSCLVALLGREGRLKEAFELIQNMPILPGVSVWGALLSACRDHGEIELGAHAAERLFRLKPNDAEPYVVLADLYSSVGRLDEAQKYMKLMSEKGLKKEPGISWIAIRNRIHIFTDGNPSHPRPGDIYMHFESD